MSCCFEKKKKSISYQPGNNTFQKELGCEGFIWLIKLVAFFWANW